MPFRSQAQRRWMYAAEARGEVPKGTAEKWQEHTPKDKPLPERVMKKKAFYTGFAKCAAAAAEAAAQPQPQALPAQPSVDMSSPRMLKWNPQGGVDPRSPEEMAAAQAVDLVTFPEGVEGANCSNCQFFRPTDEALGTGFCSQPEVKQDVSRSMCCARWNAPGTYRAWEAVDPSAVPNPEIMGEAGALQAGEEAIPGGEQPIDGEAGTEEGDAAAFPTGAGAEKEPGKEEKKPADKKPKKDEKEKGGKGGHTINVNVGGEKTASLAELLGL